MKKKKEIKSMKNKVPISLHYYLLLICIIIVELLLSPPVHVHQIITSYTLNYTLYVIYILILR